MPFSLSRYLKDRRTKKKLKKEEKRRAEQAGQRETTAASATPSQPPPEPRRVVAPSLQATVTTPPPVNVQTVTAANLTPEQPLYPNLTSSPSLQTTVTTLAPVPVQTDATLLTLGAANFTTYTDVNDNSNDDWKIRLLTGCGTKAIGEVDSCPVMRGCLQCGTLIEHDGGDKHVRCELCSCQFCFVCLSAKNPVGGWECTATNMCRVAPRQTFLLDYQQSGADQPAQDVALEFEDILLDELAAAAIYEEELFMQDLQTGITTSETQTTPSELSLEENGYADDGKLQPLRGYIQLSTEACCVMFDDSIDDRAKMPCGHVISVEGMRHLCESTLKNSDYEFKCPAESCSSTWEYFLVRHVLSSVLSPEELEDVSSKINTNYVAKKCIEQCPMCGLNCERDFSRYEFQNKNRVACLACTNKNGRSTEFCWNCVKEWKGDNSGCGNANCDTVWKIRELANCGTKRIDPVSNCPEIRGCPRCGTLIYHTRGCKQIICKSCRLAFCFICLKPEIHGKLQCGGHFSVCKVAPRQTRLPEGVQ